ncbi:MAG: response regulator [Chloroflexota bacterium]
MNTVLVVDDQADVRLALRFLLEDEGYIPVEASEGQAGLETAVRLQPALILLDVNMPGMDGLKTLSCLKSDARTALIPVFLMSGDSGNLICASELGAADAITKPWEERSLIRQVQRVMDSRSDYARTA